MRSIPARIVLVVVLAVIALPALAQQQISFPDFSSTANLTCNGNAANGGVCVNSGTALKLTDASGGEAGSAWFSTSSAPVKIPLANGFTTNFQFRFTSPSSPPADGIAFVIQNTGLNALADDGGSIGYGDSDNANDPAGFASLAIEFDTYRNSWDPGVPHVAVQSCGGTNFNTADHAFCNYGISALGAVPPLSDGNVHTATINYVVNPTPTLSVFVDGTQVLTTSVNISTVMGLDTSGDAYVGFTAATGADFEEHDILNWNLSTTATQPTPITTTPTVTAIFNSAKNNIVQHVVDFSGALSTPTGNEPTNPVMSNSNQAIAPADWVKYVANSPLATTSCIPHNGEGGNCKLYIDLCTSEGNPTPAGINCPQSSADNIVIQDTFDATPKPTTAPGTGFGFLMGGDGWSTQGQASCIFGGPLTGTSCPQDILVSFTGDTNSSAGRTKSLNSTFVTVSGVLMPNTFTSVSPTNSYGWTNTPTPTLSFASYPPGIGSGTPVPLDNTNHPVNGYIAAPIASIAYNVNGAAIPLSPILNSASCFGTPTTPGGPVPLNAAIEFAPAPVPLALNQGLNTMQYSATDCAGISELVFTFDVPSQTWSTGTKSAPVYVDSVPPAANCPAADTLWHNGDVMLNCPATDNASGFAPVTSTVGGTSFGALSLNVPLSTNVGGGPVEVTNAFTGSTVISDLAGNTATAGPVGPFKIDTKAPIINAVSPPQGSVQNYFLNQTVKTTATYDCSDGGSGVAKCGTASYAPAVQGTTANISNNVNTAVLGQSQSFTISAKDAVGNSANANLFTYNVSYLFLGFLALQQPPLTNPLKAGKATALLFDVQDGRPRPVMGLKLAPAGTVTVAAFSSTNCSGTNPTAVAFNGTLAGLPLGIYSLNWTPPSTLAGKCVTVNVGLGDGLTHRVNLKF